jgi:hypothetical protein
MTDRLADNARQALVEVLAEVNGGSGCADDMADAILSNPDVVVRALIAAGHSTLTLMDGVPVYIVEVKG